jgi:hypothetical protein
MSTISLFIIVQHVVEEGIIESVLILSTKLETEHGMYHT